jgi:hypothetical protein
MSTTIFLSIVLLLSTNKTNIEAVEDYKVDLSKNKIQSYKDSIQILTQINGKLQEEKEEAISLKDQNYNNFLELEKYYSKKDKEYQILKNKKIQSNQLNLNKNEKIETTSNDSLGKYVHEYILTSYRKRHYK